MLREKAFRIGRIIKTHGVSGQISVAADMKIRDTDDWPDWIFLDIDVGLVPFKTRKEDVIWRDETHLIIGLDDITSQDKARELVGFDIWFPEESKYLLAESVNVVSPLVGYILSDLKSGELGRIVELIDLPNNPLFKIIVEDKEILIPAREEWIVDQDDKATRITMDLPDGLLDL